MIVHSVAWWNTVLSTVLAARLVVAGIPHTVFTDLPTTTVTPSWLDLIKKKRSIVKLCAHHAYPMRTKYAYRAQGVGATWDGTGDRHTR